MPETNVYISALGNFPLNISFRRTVVSPFDKVWGRYISADSPKYPDFNMFDITFTATKLSMTNFFIYE